MIEFLLLITGIVSLLFFRSVFRKVAQTVEDQADLYREETAIDAAIERQENHKRLTDYMTTHNVVKLHQHADIMRLLQGK